MNGRYFFTKSSPLLSRFFSMVILDGVLDGSSIPWPSDVPRGRMQRWQKVTNVHITAVSLYLISLEVLLAEQ